MSVCSSFYAHSEIVKDIVIEGNERISDETVIIYGEIKKNEDYNDQKINEVLNNLYSTNFFKDVKIVFNNGVLKIQLDEYPIINQLIILGEDRNSLKEQIKKIIKSKVNDSFICLLKPWNPFLKPFNTQTRELWKSFQRQTVYGLLTRIFFLHACRTGGVEGVVWWWWGTNNL